jgi:hypothetical protein
VRLQVIQGLKGRFFQGRDIAPGTVSVHIRRGDKAKKTGGEMAYVPDEVYQNLARALQSSNSDVLLPAVFVSTEGPTAVQSIKDNMTNWTVQFTTVPRNNHQGLPVSCLCAQALVACKVQQAAAASDCR